LFANLDMSGSGGNSNKPHRDIKHHCGFFNCMRAFRYTYRERERERERELQLSVTDIVRSSFSIQRGYHAQLPHVAHLGASWELVGFIQKGKDAAELLAFNSSPFYRGAHYRLATKNFP
jgi:hypothetical protein